MSQVETEKIEKTHLILTVLRVLDSSLADVRDGLLDGTRKDFILKLNAFNEIPSIGQIERIIFY